MSFLNKSSGIQSAVILSLAVILFSGALAGCGKSDQKASSQFSSRQNSESIQTSESSVSREQQLSSIREAPAEGIVDTTGMNDEEVRSCFYSEPLSAELVSMMDGDMYSTAQNFITPKQLRLINILYMGFDGQTHVGQIAANELISQDLEEIFHELYLQAYPIERVVLPFGYGADDERVMTDDITRALAFTWSDGVPDEHEHSLGLAVDFNSLYNPQVITEDGSLTVLPAAALPYADRSVLQPHMMNEADPAVQAFLRHGFTWGGVWQGRNDYQHFEKYFNHDTGHADPGMYQ